MKKLLNMNLWILLIFILNIHKASANKYCSLESNGEPKYFICARNEYCCHFGCCVHLAFQFYQLWYYWLLLIFMFMLCSGGSWWYKFCRQHESTTYPSLPPSFERQTRQTLVDTRRNRSVDRNTAENSLYFQRIWKANGVGPPPNYYTASVVRYHSASELETRRQQQECPYYQLYGPPPSYESVVRIPENGYGQPSCTLVPSTTSQQQQQQQQHQQQQQQQHVSGYIPDNPSSSSVPGHVVIDSQLNPGPSTSVQTDFVVVPIHSNHHSTTQPSSSGEDTSASRVITTSISVGPTTSTATSTSPVAQLLGSTDLGKIIGIQEHQV